VALFAARANGQNNAGQFVGTWYTVPGWCTPSYSCCCNNGVWNLTQYTDTIYNAQVADTGCFGSTQETSENNYTVDAGNYAQAQARYFPIVGNTNLYVTQTLVTPGQLKLQTPIAGCYSYSCRNVSDPIGCPAAFNVTVPIMPTGAPVSSSSSTGSAGVFDPSQIIGNWIAVPNSCKSGPELGECCCYSGSSSIKQVGTNLLDLQTGVSGGPACLDDEYTYQLNENFTMLSPTVARWSFIYQTLPVYVELRINATYPQQFSIINSELPSCISYGCRSLTPSTCGAVLDFPQGSSTGTAAGAVHAASSPAAIALAALVIASVFATDSTA